MIKKPNTAFSKDKPKRVTRGRKPVKLDAYRKWIKSLPSLITAKRTDVEVAHVSLADPTVGKRTRGKSQKADDFYVVPLSRVLHAEAHRIGEKAFQRQYSINLINIAMAFYIHAGDDETAELIVSESVRKRK